MPYFLVTCTVYSWVVTIHIILVSYLFLFWCGRIFQLNMFSAPPSPVSINYRIRRTDMKYHHHTLLLLIRVMDIPLYLLDFSAQSAKCTKFTRCYLPFVLHWFALKIFFLCNLLLHRPLTLFRAMWYISERGKWPKHGTSKVKESKVPSWPVIQVY